MTAKITIAALLLLILCPLGCLSLDKQHNKQHNDIWRKDLKTFRIELDYYVFNIDRLEDNPQRTDRSIFRQAGRDLRAANEDWHYFIHGIARPGRIELP